MMKKRWLVLTLCILIPLLVGFGSALLTRGGMQDFDSVLQPPLSPPAWLFPIVWTVLYISMGVASYFVLTAKKLRVSALYAYLVQLVLNFVWPLIFFNLQNYLFAFICLAALWAAVLVTTILFYRIRRISGILMTPYLVWITFAGYLNYSIYNLNR